MIDIQGLLMKFCNDRNYSLSFLLEKLQSTAI